MILGVPLDPAKLNAKKLHEPGTDRAHHLSEVHRWISRDGTQPVTYDALIECGAFEGPRLQQQGETAQAEAEQLAAAL